MLGVEMKLSHFINTQTDAKPLGASVMSASNLILNEESKVPFLLMPNLFPLEFMTITFFPKPPQLLLMFSSSFKGGIQRFQAPYRSTYPVSEC